MKDDLILSKLNDGERVVWQKKTKLRLYRAAPFFAVLISGFGLLVALPLLFLVFTAGSFESISDIIIFGIFILLGFISSIYPWVAHHLPHGDMVCLITNQRALWVYHKPGKLDLLQEFLPNEINRIVGWVYSDGSGNIFFKKEYQFSTADISLDLGLKMSIPIGFRISDSGFLDIPDVQGAADALAKLTDIVPDIKPRLWSYLLSKFK